MSKSILQETLHLTEEDLSAFFTPPKKAISLLQWLDPERFASLGTFNLQDTYEFLPAMYRALADNLQQDADWREVISNVVQHNVASDNHLERWISAAKFEKRRKEAFYSVPFIPSQLDEKLGGAPMNTLWALYVIPLLLTKRPLEQIAISDIYRRKLDYNELYSRRYTNMSVELSPPPGLVVESSELPNPEGKPFTLIEGALRVSKAEQQGERECSCKVIPWETLSPFIHIQPIQGDYSYQLPDFSVGIGDYR